MDPLVLNQTPECGTDQLKDDAEKSGKSAKDKIYWWEEPPLLPREQMTAEELARPPYAYCTTGVQTRSLHRHKPGPSSTMYAQYGPEFTSDDELYSRYQSPQLADIMQLRQAASDSRRGYAQSTTEPLATAVGNPSTSFTARSHSMNAHHLRYAPRPPQPRNISSLIESLCDQHDVLLYLVSFLTLPDILNLYAISKRFHFLWNANYVAYIRASLRTWAPGAGDIFPWTCYKSLCIKDPYVRQKSRWTNKEDMVQRAHEDKRDVPSLRWLQMVVYREGVSLDILIQMALKGLRCMPKTSEAVKRMWFLMDLPLNAHRIALMRSQTYITNKTLLQMTGFMLKVDMFFTDPFGQPYPFGHANERLHQPEWAGQTFTGVEMREYLLAERSMTPLWRVLRGWSPDPSDPQIPMTRLDVLRLWARHKFNFPDHMPETMKKMSFLGVPWWQIGTARLERVGTLKHVSGNINSTQGALASILPLAGLDNSTPVPMLTVTPTNRVPETLHGLDDLVMLEAIRRRLKLHVQWLPLMAWGSHDGRGRLWPMFTEEDMNRALLGKRLRPNPQP